MYGAMPCLYNRLSMTKEGSHTPEERRHKKALMTCTMQDNDWTGEKPGRARDRGPYPDCNAVAQLCVPGIATWAVDPVSELRSRARVGTGTVLFLLRFSMEASCMRMGNRGFPHKSKRVTEWAAQCRGHHRGSSVFIDGIWASRLEA